MPRKSAEQRAAELWRIGNKPPPPPADLAPPARKLWKEIACSKPGDFWTPTLRTLLGRFVKTSEYAERIAARLDELPIGDSEALALGRQMTAANASLCGLATKMRLSAQNMISPHSREQMADPGPGPLDDLLGGRAVHGPRTGFPDAPQ
jgi:hypothetical protein